MKARAVVALLAVPALLAGGSARGFAESKQIPTVVLTQQVEIAAPPSAVWTNLTQGRSLVTWCPMWKKDANAKTNLSKVGDALDYTDSWGGGGRSIVTYFVKDKELRVQHEPNDGSYMCQSKVLLSPGGAGTVVQWTDQYTDASKPADLKATAEKTGAEMAAFLQALKRTSEK